MNAHILRKMAWIHVENRALLCVRSHGKALFYTPGGKPEAGEEDADALLRELDEELNIALDRDTIEPAGTFCAPADGRPGWIVEIHAYRARHRGDFVPGNEIAEYRFMASRDRDMLSVAGRAILQHLKDSDCID